MGNSIPRVLTITENTMKIFYSVLILSSLMTGFAAQAEDVSATLSITGDATSGPTGCEVNMNPTTIALDTIDLDALPWQGGNTIPKNPINLSISGSSECYALVLADRMAYRFVGTPDAGEGSVLANIDTSSQAAKGVGIGIFDMHGKFLDIRKTVSALDLQRITMQVVSLKGTEQKPTEGHVSGNLTVQIERL